LLGKLKIENKVSAAKAGDTAHEMWRLNLTIFAISKAKA
jgi:hypothetical protein